MKTLLIYLLLGASLFLSASPGPSGTEKRLFADPQVIFSTWTLGKFENGKCADLCLGEIKLPNKKNEILLLVHLHIRQVINPDPTEEIKEATLYYNPETKVVWCIAWEDKNKIAWSFIKGLDNTWWRKSPTLPTDSLIKG